MSNGETIVSDCTKLQAAEFYREAGSAWWYWLAAFALVLALHVGVGMYLLASAREVLDGNPDDVINVEFMPDPSPTNDRPDDAPGPKVVEAAAPTSDRTEADDPNPPAPDAAPPTEIKREPEVAPPLMAPLAPANAQAVLPPTEKKPEKRPSELKLPVEKPLDAKPDKVDKPTAPSQASNGSAALLGGGHRPSKAVQARWQGEILSHLVHLRRYPKEARTRGWEGKAKVRVTIDGEGHVIGAPEVITSTGREVLDKEALALMGRSDPFPKPPSGLPSPVTLTVPVKFGIEDRR